MVLRPKLPALRLSIALIPLIALAQAAHAQLLGSAGLAGSINETTLPAARAPLLTYGIDAGIGESDNVTLAPTDKISQTIAITDADFAVTNRPGCSMSMRRVTSPISITCRMPMAVS